MSPPTFHSGFRLFNTAAAAAAAAAFVPTTLIGAEEAPAIKQAEVGLAGGVGGGRHEQQALADVKEIVQSEEQVRSGGGGRELRRHAPKHCH